MIYTEDLEKRIEELEREVQFLSKVGEEAFLFRRIEKIIDSNLKKLERKKEKLSKSKEVADLHRRTSIELSSYEHIRRDIILTREDMKRYDLKQLLADDFFKF